MGFPSLRYERGDGEPRFVCEMNCGQTNFRGTVYYFERLDFHAPSEHRSEGEQFPLEAHLVHRSSANAEDLLIVAYIFKIGDGIGEGDGFNRALNNIVTQADFSAGSPFTVDLGALVKGDTYCTYEGSLTSPPCTDSVTWLLARSSQWVRSDQVAALATRGLAGEPGSSPPVEMLRNRQVTCFME